MSCVLYMKNEAFFLDLTEQYIDT
uniref:Uncharacterized protein n=1 Tax=Anguilla anguilla TaxID=7936 RepID=A0A0E9SQA0_ANGAN